MEQQELGFSAHTLGGFCSHLVTHLRNKGRLAKCRVSYPNRRVKLIQMLRICQLCWSRSSQTLPRGNNKACYERGKTRYLIEKQILHYSKSFCLAQYTSMYSRLKNYEKCLALILHLPVASEVTVEPRALSSPCPYVTLNIF